MNNSILELFESLFIMFFNFRNFDHNIYEQKINLTGT